MCGIFGVFHQTRATDSSRNLLESIAGILRHRGPDDFGVYTAAGVGLVHTRLSLLDLNARSKQPFWDENRRYCLVYNGEIYNYQKLKDGLQEAGVVFRTTSDTEVLLESLIRYDPHVILPKLEGMFAFAIYDSHEKSLMLARDRFGIKPLYIYHKDEIVIFSSEIKAISEYINIEPDSFSISSFLYGFGGPTKDHTFFKGIKFVTPGSFIKIKAGQTAIYSKFFEITDFWDGNEAENLKRLPLNTVVNQTEKLLFNSVKQHLIADAPVGALCSGGLDSSLITAMASRVHNNLAIFHANVVGPNSEYEAALILARHLKLELHSIDLDETQFFDTAPDVVEHYEHPFSYHLNSIPFLKVAQLIRDNGVKAILSGEGADECYLGYDFVVNEHRLLSYRKFPKLVQTFLARLPKVRAFIPPAEDHTTEFLLHLHNRFETLTDQQDTIDKLSDGCISSKREYSGTLNLLNYHLRTLLHRNDALGMAASVEARFPFLNHKLVQLAVNTPYSAKIRFGLSRDPGHRFLRDKWVLRQIARRYLPPELSQRRKLGFRFGPSERMQVSDSYFYDSPLSNLLGLSRKSMQFLLARCPGDLLLKLLHLDMWAHVCLYRLSKASLCNRLKENVKLNSQYWPVIPLAIIT